MSRRNFDYDHVTITYAVWLWYRRNGRWPVSRDWKHAGEDFPSAQTARRYFPTWSALILSAVDLDERVIAAQRARVGV